MLLKAFRNSKRNSKFLLSEKLNFLEIPMSARVKRGPWTINVVNPQPPVKFDTQLSPAGARYRSRGVPPAIGPVGPPDKVPVPYPLASHPAVLGMQTLNARRLLSI